MVAKKKTYTLSSKAVAAIGGLGLCCVVAGAAFAVEGHRSDLVNRKVLRVCADPANLPFSNEKKEGFENKIAEIIGNELNVPVEYTWFPQATGFTRNTLLAKRCDVIIGTGQGDELVLNTNALYRSAYALIYKPGTGLDGVESIFDPKLKGKKVGTVQGTPSANLVAKAGLMDKARPYRLMVDRRYDDPSADMVKDIRSGEIDAGVMWGPIAGYYAIARRRQAHCGAADQGRRQGRSSRFPHHHGRAPGRRPVEAAAQRRHPQTPGGHRQGSARVRRADDR